MIVLGRGVSACEGGELEVSFPVAFLSRRHRQYAGLYCKLCPYKTLIRVNFEAHLRVHTGEKPFTCSHASCAYATNGVHELKRHVRLRHGLARSGSTG